MTPFPPNFELDRYGLHVRLVREEDAGKCWLKKVPALEPEVPSSAE